MQTTRPLATSFGLKVVLPSAVAAGVICYLLYTVINGLLAEMSNANSAYARHAAQVFQSYVQDQLATIVTDNANWDDALEHTRGGGDPQWFKETWGLNSGDGNYNAVLLLDGDGGTIEAFRDGQPAEKSSDALIGVDTEELARLIAPLRDRSEVTMDLSRAAGVLHAFALAPIVSTDGQPEQGGNQRFLLMARALGADYLASKGMQFGLDGLHTSERPLPGEGYIALQSSGGDAMGYLAWKLSDSDLNKRARYGQIVWAILGSLVFVVSLLINMIWKGYREAHDVKAKAIASAYSDDLTGLPNRRQVINTLTKLLAKRHGGDNGLSLVFADLDGFKEVNDAYGHEIGDMLLKTAAAGFQFLSTGRGIVARLGGDEFCVLVPGPDAAKNAREVAHNMLRFMAEPVVFGGRVASVSVSAGIVDRSSHDNGIDAEEFLRRADAAMYAAKSSGRNRIQIYEPALDHKREEARRIARELRAHLDASAFTMVYQPIVDARTRAINGVEALVRWPGNAGRRVPPDVFIPIAEEFGMIEELGYFVLQQACRQALQWPALTVSVNVSPLQFMNPAFAETVERVLNQTGLEAQRLVLEVTEGFIIENGDRAAAIINRLHRMNVSIALDDFGTGFSSIGHLRRFRFDKLKLDRSMVSDILVHPPALRLVQGTIAMADALGLSVTAEGVEDENQVSVLRLAGCSQFQGFLFSKPVEPQRITAMLQGKAQALVG